MSDSDSQGWGTATLGVRAGQQRTPEQEHAEPIFTTSSFTYGSAAEAAAKFAETEPGNIYSRFTNPTVRTFEERLAAMEGGEACVGTASGMSAILSTCMALLDGGDHIVASASLFGSTVSLFNNHLSRFGVSTTFVPLADLAAWEAAITPRTRMLFVETPSNPLTELVDLERLAGIAREHGVMLVVDNCFCTPALQRPLALGADLVVHSATKYLDGQGRCVGGAVVGDSERVGKKVRGFLRNAGPCMSPFNAWVFLKGLETLAVRMRAHGENAAALAGWLETHPAVERVYYPGLESHAQHVLAARQQRGFGGIVSFDVVGGRDNAWAVVDATRMLSITANLGDTRTTITHPATTTHGRNTDDQRRAAGIGEGLLRISVGLEDVDDIKNDLARGLQRLE
ncbi:O-succinylhomoserine sulfhydrylase [Arhodomonas sp. AD133]|uniref:O-succinylhomoserine sulfhydrylase n=1 Tax=Arhodomonas sp. AD133 TaxID=3415009 RepID=UPI003EB87A1E